MSKVSAQNGNWNKARLRWVVIAFICSFDLLVTLAEKATNIKKD